MVHVDEVTQQLRRLGAHNMMWCRAELRELPKILFRGEQIEHIVTGRYEGGYALLVATNNRVLLIDKKPFYLTLEDVRYDMISDVLFYHRLVDATIRLGNMNKTIVFTAFNKNKLRELTAYIQEEVMLYRHQAGQQQHQHNHNADAPHNHVEQPQPALQPAYMVEQEQTAQPIFASMQPAASVPNPYKTPVLIRRRVSRFY